MNQINMITPFKKNGVWVFNDNNKGLIEEPFVGDINKMIDKLTSSIKDAEKGFNLMFSGKKMPGSFRVRRLRKEYGGWWYHWKELEITGWLCPAMFKYFKWAPKYIYFSIQPKI